MNRFALILKSLDQAIPLEDLQAASVAVPSIAREDCPRMHRLMAGILHQGMSHGVATQFQLALQKLGHETEIVPQHDVRALPSDFTIQRLSTESDPLIARDSFDRVQYRSKAEMAFVAAAVLDDEELVQRSVFKTEWESVRGGAIAHSKLVRQAKLQPKRLLRIDLFFLTEPYRLRLAAAESGRFFLNEQAVELRRPESISAAFALLETLLPADRQFLRRGDDRPFGYQMYESTLRWCFYRLNQDACF